MVKCNEEVLINFFFSWKDLILEQDVRGTIECYCILES